MTAGENFEYLWMNPDDPRYDKPTAVCAKEYVSLLMEWVESLLNDENVFPSDPNQDFPKVCFCENNNVIYVTNLPSLCDHIYNIDTSIGFFKNCKEYFQEIVPCLCTHLCTPLGTD